MTARPPILRAAFEGLVVDSFAGGGGASTGIEAALGRPVDIAINHDPEAIALCADIPYHTYRQAMWRLKQAGTLAVEGRGVQATYRLAAGGREKGRG